MVKENISRILTVKEFAKRIRVHPNTVRNGIRCGRIQAFKVGQGKRAAYRIFSSELQRIAAFDSIEIIENIIRGRK